MKYFSVIIAWKLVIALKVMILADSFFFCLAWKGAVRDLTVCLSIHGLSTTSDVTGLPLQVHLVDNHSLSSPYYLLLPMTFWSHYSNLLNFVVFVHLLSWVWLFVTPGTEAHQISLSFTISQSLFRFMSIESVMPSSHLIFCHPLLLLSVFLSIRVFFFSSESVFYITWPKCWSFSFISPSNEYSELMSFRINWFDLLVVQGTLNSLLQHHNSKASILQHSTFFMVQLSHLYMTTGESLALTLRTFVSRVISLHFNMLSRLVLAFLPRSKHLLISWPQLLLFIFLVIKWNLFISKHLHWGS